MALKHRGASLDRLRVDFDQGQLYAANRLLATIPKGFERALSSAVNRSLTAGQAEVGRQVRDEYTVKLAEVKRTVSIKRSTPTKVRGQLISSGSRIPLEGFDHTPRSKDTTGKKRKLIRVQVSKKRGAQGLRTGFKYKGRILTRSDGYYNQQSSYAAIKQPKWFGRGVGFRYGPSVPEMLGNQRVSEVVQDYMTETLKKRIDQEVYRLLKV